VTTSVLVVVKGYADPVTGFRDISSTQQQLQHELETKFFASISHPPF